MWNWKLRTWDIYIIYWIYMKHWPTIPSHSSQTSSAGSAAACCDGFTVAPGVMAKMSDQQSTWKNLGKIWATSGQEIWIRALGLATRKLSKTQAFSRRCWPTDFLWMLDCCYDMKSYWWKNDTQHFPWNWSSSPVSDSGHVWFCGLHWLIGWSTHTI